MASFQLFNEDCLGRLQGMPDQAVDLVLTDPPYGIKVTHQTNRYGKAKETGRTATHEAWDDHIPGPEYFFQMQRVSRHQIIFGGNYFLDYLGKAPCMIIWDKRGNLPDVPFADVELAWTNYDRSVKKYTFINHGFIRDSKDPKTGHPTQKPSELMAMILADFAVPGQVILDPFMGTGSTGVAAARMGMDFIGIEIDPGYYATALKRVKAAYSQLNLPGL